MGTWPWPRNPSLLQRLRASEVGRRRNGRLQAVLVAGDGPAPLVRHRSCQWPEGDPRAAGFRLCGCADLVRGRPYCAEHCAIAYVAPAAAA